MAVQLFAIRHAEELADVSKGDLSQQALGKDFAATITDAVKLARYVQITKDPFGQAEGEAQIPEDYFTPSGTLAFATLVGTVLAYMERDYSDSRFTLEFVRRVDELAETSPESVPELLLEDEEALQSLQETLRNSIIALRTMHLE